MKLSDNTLNILKNYANINQGILVKEGNVLTTISPQKTVLARAELDESFETRFAIYDLHQFLSVLSTFSDEADLTFDETFLTITTEGFGSVTYRYASEEMIMTAPKESLPTEDDAVVFELNQNVLVRATKMAGVLGVEDISIIGEDGKLSIAVSDTKNDSSNEFKVEVGETDRDFHIVLHVMNVNTILPDNYKITLGKSAVKFESENGKLVYWIAPKRWSRME